MSYTCHLSKSKILMLWLDLSRQTNTTISQQNSFTGKLEEEDVATMLLMIEKQTKNFYLDSLIVAE